MSKYRRAKNVVLGVLAEPFNLIVLAALVLLGYLILAPLADMIFNTFRVSLGDLRRVPGAQVGDFTLFHWVRLLASDVSGSLFFVPLRNSVVIGLNVAVFSISAGSLLAWLMVRSDLPGKKVLYLLLLVPFMLPSWTISMMWLTIFRTGQMGGAPGFLAGLGVAVPTWLAYGQFPIIVVLSISNFAFSYLLVSGALLSINSEVEEMALIMGAGKFRTLRKITFPLVLPAILSAFVLTFSRSIGSFGTPALLGLNVNYHVVSTMLFWSLRARDNSAGHAITIVLIAIVAAAVYLHQKLIGVRRGYAVIAGKGKRPAPVSLRKWKYPVLILIVVFMFFAIVMPTGILLMDTFMLVPGRYELSNFTLHYWIGEGGDPGVARGMQGIFRKPWFYSSLRTTLTLTVVVSTVGMFAGQFLGYVFSRGRGRVTVRILEQVAFMPYMIPSISLGAVYLSMFISPRLFVPSLYGTFTLLVIISLVDNLPFASRAGTSTMMQIGTDMEEAALISGASFFRRFGKIILPLSRPGFLTGFILIFMSVIRDFDLIILLMAPGTTTIAYMVFSLVQSGYEAHANVLSAIMFFIVFFVYALASKIGKIDLTAGYGGGK